MTADRDPTEERSNAEVAMALVSALGRRADEVGIEPTPQARAAVDRRRRRRARRRQARRGAAVAALVVAIGASTALVQRDETPSVVAGPDDPPPAACDQVLRPGQAGDDPASLGLPRLVFEASAGLTPALKGEPLVTVRPDDPDSTDTTTAQLFSPRDAVLPVIVVPWSSTEPFELPPPGDDVEVNGIPAAFTGTAPDWVTLAWTMADGTKTWLSAYGVEQDELLRFAEGLSVDPDRPGYVADTVPAGFVESVPEMADRSDDAGYTAMVHYSLRGHGLDVAVAVYSEPIETDRSPLESVLSDADDAEPITVLGENGMLIHYPEGRWMIAWQAGTCLANVTITGGATRPQVDALLAALHLANDAEWADLLASQP